MYLMARVQRKGMDGKVQEAIVNPACVRYVYAEKGGGSYIAFEDEHGPNSEGVTPIGISSPDSVKKVKNRLNRPYCVNVTLRAGSLFLSAAAIVVAIWYSSGSG